MVKSAKTTFSPWGQEKQHCLQLRNWIILKFDEVKSPILVKTAFQKQSPKASPRDIPDVKQFVWVLTKFNGGSDIGESKPKHNVKDSVPQPDIDAV